MKRNALRYLGLVSQIGLQIVISVVIGTVIGVYIDRRFGTMIIFTFIFIIIGAASGIWSAYQLMKKISLDELDK